MPSLIRNKTISAFFPIVGIFVGLFSQVAKAQDEEEIVYFEEVLVTAERRSSDILETPMTITAFSSEMLVELGLQDRDKLQNLVPGLQFGDAMDQKGNGVTLRGIGTREAGMNHMDRAVAQYINGAYTIGTYGTMPGGGFDLQTIEIARGPQGTLNGRNSMAGAINFVYKKPSQEWDADLQLELLDVPGGTQERANVAFGGPIDENLSFRVTAGTHQGDGVQENLGVGPDYGAPDHTFGALQLRWQNENIDANVRYSHIRDQGTSHTLVQLMRANRTLEVIELVGGYSIGNPPPTPSTQTNFRYLYESPVPAISENCPIGMPAMRCGDIENKVAYNFPNYSDSRAKGWEAYVSIDITEDLNMRYTFSDRDTNQLNVKEYDYTNRVGTAEDYTVATDGGVPLLDRFGELPYDYEEESHEILFTYTPSDQMTVQGGVFQYKNKTRWAVIRNEMTNWWRFGTADETWQSFEGSAFGIDALSNFTSCQDGLEKFHDVFGINITAEQAAATSGYWYTCPEGDEHTQNVYYGTRASQESRAIFANVDYVFNDQWAGSAGLRYVEDEKFQGREGQAGFFCSGWFGAGFACSGFDNGGFDYPHTWDAVVGQATLEYTMSNDNLLYARISTGHQSGVFNREENGQIFAQDWSDEATLLNWEIGSKGLLLDGKLQYAIGAYLMQYDDMQIEAFQLAPAGSSVGPFAETPVNEYAGNIPDTDVWGVEIEYAYAINERTQLVGFYAYQDSELGEHASVVPGDPDALWDYHEHIDGNTGQFITSPYQLPADQTGNQLPNQPKNKFAATLIHDWPLDNGSSLTFIGTYNWIDEAFPTIANIELYKLPSYYRLDLSAAWTNAAENLNVQVFVNNVTDEIGLNEFLIDNGLGNNQSNMAIGMPTNHRQVGIRVNYSPNF